MTGTPILRLVDLSKKFDDLRAVDGIDLEIYDGEFFTVVGPSGSGKTTLLRMLGGMDQPSQGDILLRGERINDIPANRRPTCMVFQSLALFPHRSVGQNIEFSMKMKGIPTADRRARAEQLMAQLHLPLDYYDKNVAQCSGGERQRIALARALAFDPEILFFDEPLSAIDYRLRKTLEKELKDIHRETAKTFVYITHSLEEAMVMSDRIGIMREGKLVQVGTPDEIYNKPRNKFVSEFMGEVNIIEVQKATEDKLECPSLQTQVVGPSQPTGFNSGHLVIRPESVRFLNNSGSAENSVEGTLYNIYSLGSRMQYQVRVGTHVFLVEKLREQGYEGELDDVVKIGWDARDSILVSD
ncbi:MAG: ABC transporter ATP-binding protein [Arenicellales bacterium]|nr:ABC transporter ATP-binding protein [Arenicellales bacterium]